VRVPGRGGHGASRHQPLQGPPPAGRTRASCTDGASWGWVRTGARVRPVRPQFSPILGRRGPPDRTVKQHAGTQSAERVGHQKNTMPRCSDHVLACRKAKIVDNGCRKQKQEPERSSQELNQGDLPDASTRASTQPDHDRRGGRSSGQLIKSALLLPLPLLRRPATGRRPPGG
jgi:hypothetical protein